MKAPPSVIALVLLSIFLLTGATLWSDELAGSDLITRAYEENYLSTEFVQALQALQPDAIDQLRDRHGRTLLHVLATRSHQARALIVLLRGADPNAKDEDGRTPLFEVLEASDPNRNGEADYMMLEMLALHGADLNAQAPNGDTPLALAVQHGDYRKAEFLVRQGAQLQPPNLAKEKSPLAIAQEKGDARMLALLHSPDDAELAARTPPTTPEAWTEKLNQALTAANLPALQAFLKQGWNIDEQNEKGETALFRAVQANQPSLVTFLLIAGADPNLADREGRTALMLTVRTLTLPAQRMTAVLLLKGADVRATTKAGETALTFAASAGHDIGVLSLVAAGGDPLAETPKGSVMNYVTHGPTMSVLNRLGVPLLKGQPTAAPPVPATPAAEMIQAARNGQFQEVENFLKQGIAANSVAQEGSDERTAMIWAANGGHFDIVDLLMQYGADINQQYKDGWHSLHYLATWPEPAPDEHNVGAKYIAEWIKRGANPDVQDDKGMTPLMIAAREGITGETTQALLDGGASLKIRNREGLTALGVAKKHGRTEMVEFLKAHGATE